MQIHKRFCHAENNKNLKLLKSQLTNKTFFVTMPLQAASTNCSANIVKISVCIGHYFNAYSILLREASQSTVTSKLCGHVSAFNKMQLYAMKYIDNAILQNFTSQLTLRTEQHKSQHSTRQSYYAAIVNTLMCMGGFPDIYMHTIHTHHPQTRTVGLNLNICVGWVNIECTYVQQQKRLCYQMIRVLRSILIFVVRRNIFLSVSQLHNKCISLSDMIFYKNTCKSV